MGNKINHYWDLSGTSAWLDKFILGYSHPFRVSFCMSINFGFELSIASDEGLLQKNNILLKELTNKTRISLFMPKLCLESTHKPCFYFFFHPYQNHFPSMPRGPLRSPYRILDFPCWYFVYQTSKPRTALAFCDGNRKSDFFPGIFYLPSTRASNAGQAQCIIMRCFISYLQTLRHPPSSRNLCPKTWRDMACDTSAHQLYGSPCRRTSTTASTRLVDIAYYASCPNSVGP